MYLIDIVLMGDNICKKFEEFVRSIGPNNKPHVFIGDLASCGVKVDNRDIVVAEWTCNIDGWDKNVNVVHVSKGNGNYAFNPLCF
jgi:hypothetical protein